VAVRNEEKRIIQCLSALTALTYPTNYEVLVIDGHSIDRTAESIEEFCVHHPNFHFYENPRKIASVGRNIGIQKSKGSIIAFTDGDIVVTQNWLQILVHALVTGQPDLAGVGGPNLVAPSAPFIERYIRVATSSFWGSGRSIQYTHSHTKKVVTSIPTCNATYWKHILVEEGGFDEQFYSGGEAAFNLHLRNKGYILQYIPEAQVFHYQDESLKSFIQRMLYYGIVRTKIIKRYPKENLAYILLILTCIVSLLLLPLYLSYFPFLLLVYVCIAWMSNLKVLHQGTYLFEFLFTPLFNLITHSFYILGLFIGYLPTTLERGIMEKVLDR
jgi:glycosyltransferase involved in cell wall biosynthesis